MADLVSDFYAGEGDLVELLEIGVIVVQKTPEFEVYQCCLLELQENLLLLLFNEGLAD